MANPFWYPDQQQANQITDFILWFSRYEYALKNVPQFSSTSKGYLEPNWTAFRGYLQQNHQPPHALNSVLAYLRAQPVQQLVGPGHWVPITLRSDWECLVTSLKTVRNNLFHGSKQGNGKLLDNPRDQILLTHCQTIMVTIIPLCPQSVRNYLT
jgi:hypothetical protein